MQTQTQQQDKPYGIVLMYGARSARYTHTFPFKVT